MKKYLVSIEQQDNPRLTKFFDQKLFNEPKSFKKIGIIGKDLKTDQYFKLAVINKTRPLSPGELGCTLSHLKVYEDFLNTDAQLAFVFEDDAISRLTDTDFQEFYSKIKTLKLDSSFFLSLGGIQLNCAKNVYGKFIEQELYGEKILKIHPLFIENLASAYAYVIDRNMAKILIDYHKSPKLSDQWDTLFAQYPSVNFYATFLFEHPPVVDSEVNSYLQKERAQIQAIQYKKKDYIKKYKKKIMKLLLHKYQ